MIDFSLDHNEHLLVEQARHLASTVLRCFGAEADRICDLPDALLSHPDLHTFMKLFVPSRFGGGLTNLKDGNMKYDLSESSLLRVLFAEEAGYGDAALFLSMPGPGLSFPLIQKYASPGLQERIFSKFVNDSQPCWGSFAMTEPRAGSDVTAISTTARPEKGGVVINGTKWFIGNGGRASWVVVLATTNVRMGRFGIRAYLVERGRPGFSAGRRLTTLGLRSVWLSELHFHNCWVPEENLIGPPGDLLLNGFDSYLMALEQFRPVVAALAVGTAQAALDYLQELVTQNGSNHTGATYWRKVRERIQSLQIPLRIARLMCRRAAWLQDRGRDSAYDISMSKAYSARVAMETCVACLDLAGRSAADQRLPLEKLFRDAKSFDIIEGTGEIHRLRTVQALIHRRKSSPHSILTQDWLSTLGDQSQ